MVDYRLRPLSPRREKETRNPFAPRKVNDKVPKQQSTKKPKTTEIDKWDGGGGSIYLSHNSSVTTTNPDTTNSKKRIEIIKRSLKGSDRDRQLRKLFKPFNKVSETIPEQSLEDNSSSDDDEEEEEQEMELKESKAFNAKRVRQIGFDPRRKANEEVNYHNNKRVIVPIVGGKISLDGVLGGDNCGGGTGKDVMDSDSDSDLDIVMGD